jgi:hypothetical protein
MKRRYAPVVLAVCLLGTAGTVSAASYKFFNGTTAYGTDGRAYSGTGTVYDAIKMDANTCPSGVVTCTTDQTAASIDFGDLVASTGTGFVVNEDLAPDFGGLGVQGGGDLDDQINGTNVLTLTFDSQVTLTGVATLFGSGHAPFGGGTLISDTLPTEAELSGQGILINGNFFTFDDVNYGNIAVTSTVFNFAVATVQGTTTGAAPVDYYVSGITVVPIPAAAWLFVSALVGLFGVARRTKLSQIEA